MIKSFEGVRGLAAMLVALYHLYGGNFSSISSPLISPIRNGYLFVDLFFLLSGYVICSAYRNRLSTAQDLASFAVRRFGRLFPLLVFASILYVIAESSLIFASNALVSHGYQGFFSALQFEPYKYPTAWEVLSTITMTHGLGFFDRLIMNYVSWSISTEFYTYLIFGVSSLFCLRIGLKTVFATLSIVGISLTTWATVSLHDCLTNHHCFSITFDFGFARCVGSFFLGALVSYVKKPQYKHANIMQAAILLVVAGFFYATPFVPGIALASPFVFGLTIYVLSIDRGFLAGFFQRNFLQVLGQRSYSIYMMHPILLMFFAAVLRQVHGALPNLVIALFYLPLLVIISGWTYRWIEDPFRTLFNRLAANAVDGGGRLKSL